MIKLSDSEKLTIKNIIDDIFEAKNTLSGCYDAKHGNEHFMYGVSTAIEYFANLVSEEYGDTIGISFIDNMIASERKADIKN